MKIPTVPFRIRRNLFLKVTRPTVLASLVLFELLSAPQSHPIPQSQTTTGTAPVFEYEVASIKPNKPSSNGVMTSMHYAANGFTATGYTLQSLIQQAFHLQDDQLIGTPAWLNTERFDVDVKIDSSVADALQKLSLDAQASARLQMLKALLVDRLKLTFHRETRELPIYLLVIAKNGPKFQEAKPGDTYSNSPAGFHEPGMRTVGRMGSESLTAQAVPLPTLVQVLSRALHRTIVDRTGLTGNYDFALRWSTDESGMQPTPGDEGAPSFPPTDAGAPTLFAAIQEQLGLKLERGKGPVEVIVIDHVERPSGN